MRLLRRGGRLRMKPRKAVPHDHSQDNSERIAQALGFPRAAAAHKASIANAELLTDKVSPLIVQAIFRELMIELRPIGNGARNLIKRIEGRS